MKKNNFSFRDHNPVRNYKGVKKKNYRDYKDHLISDFSGRCGYTNCSHFWFGGKSNFHIDHFAPKSKFEHLETEYSNLIYCCSYVNRAKSNDWPSDDENLSVLNGEGYIDPCHEDFNEYFYRDNTGQIIPYPEKPVANYMYKKLKLYLKRYSLIWKLDQLKSKISSLYEAQEKNFDTSIDEEIEVLLSDLNREYHRYENYLAEVQ